MGVHLVKAMGMLNEAVEAQPNNGAIVDSVGWAHYRLGRYDEAVDELERAVQMVPEDPIVNDHLGDAYWKVGRKREAFFQWTHARDLEPDETLLPLVLAKLENGPTEAAAEPAGPGDAKVPASIEVAAGDSLWTIAARVYGDAWLYRRIFEANRDSLSDPDLIYPGMTLDIPDPGAN
jgi:nucleoid-associated protein YgaU